MGVTRSDLETQASSWLLCWSGAPRGAREQNGIQPGLTPDLEFTHVPSGHFFRPRTDKWSRHACKWTSPPWPLRWASLVEASAAAPK